MKAIILVGGEATRLRPLTLQMPKALIPLQGKPILEHVLELFKRFDITDIVLSVGYLKEMIIKHFGDGAAMDLRINFIKEDEPLGTAGSLSLLSDKPTSTFIVCNGDELKDINISAMLEAHRRHGGLATLALTKVKDPSMYGVARMQEEQILEFVEKPKRQDAPSNLINAGFYVLEPEVLAMIPAGRAMFEYDIFPRLAAEGKLFGYEFDGQWLDTGTPERLAKAEHEWKGIGI
jgi:NDP-sugar pyrophosphorylase family protein